MATTQMAQQGAEVTADAQTEARRSLDAFAQALAQMAVRGADAGTPEDPDEGRRQSASAPPQEAPEAI